MTWEVSLNKVIFLILRGNTTSAEKNLLRSSEASVFCRVSLPPSLSSMLMGCRLAADIFTHSLALSLHAAEASNFWCPVTRRTVLRRLDRGRGTKIFAGWLVILGTHLQCFCLPQSKNLGPVVKDVTFQNVSKNATFVYKNLGEPYVSHSWKRKILGYV